MQWFFDKNGFQSEYLSSILPFSSKQHGGRKVNKNNGSGTTSYDDTNLFKKYPHYHFYRL